MILHYCVYVLQSEKDRLLYHGYTINLLQRLKKHTNWEDVFVAAKPMKFNAFNTGLSTVKLKTYADTTSFPENVDIKMVLNCDILAFSFKHPQKGELGLLTRGSKVSPPRLAKVNFLQSRHGNETDLFLSFVNTVISF